VILCVGISASKQLRALSIEHVVAGEPGNTECQQKVNSCVLYLTNDI
jgi:hypothetical protein